jgi:hypothetical protein
MGARMEHYQEKTPDKTPSGGIIGNRGLPKEDRWEFFRVIR